MKDLISAKEAAKVLAVSDRRVRALIGAGLLQGTKVGSGFVLSRQDVEEFAKTRNTKSGRPRRKD